MTSGRRDLGQWNDGEDMIINCVITLHTFKQGKGAYRGHMEGGKMFVCTNGKSSPNDPSLPISKNIIHFRVAVSLVGVVNVPLEE